tara:strand:- start:150 stop:338 length:189 start_codon:yes stop_codon:yes gene_type:complete
MKTKYSNIAFLIAFASYLIMIICITFREADIALCFAGFGLFCMVNAFNVKIALKKSKLTINK